jgi:soluble lytic murein transglycosylase-like protein
VSPNAEVVLKLAPVAAIAIIVASGTCAVAARPQAVAGPLPGPGRCAVGAFAGARSLLSRVPASERTARTPGAGFSERWQAFERAATAIVGFDQASVVPGAGFEDFVSALETGQPQAIACNAAMIARDRLAYRLAMVGYSTREVGTILLGEASPAQVDADYARSLAALPTHPAPDSPAPVRASLPQRLGLPAEAAGAKSPVVLPSWSEPVHAVRVPTRAMRPATLPGRRAVTGPAPPAVQDVVDAQIRHYADAYQVDYRLVSAIIRQESNWQQAAVSSKGAVGLMQLMPATAAMLNVNPPDPVDNIRGGIAYLAGLLRTYGELRHALIAYNAGPTHANQVIRGERVLFAETRRYLDAIASVYPLN